MQPKDVKSIVHLADFIYQSYLETGYQDTKGLLQFYQSIRRSAKKKPIRDSIAAIRNICYGDTTISQRPGIRQLLDFGIVGSIILGGADQRLTGGPAYLHALLGQEALKEADSPFYKRALYPTHDWLEDWTGIEAKRKGISKYDKRGLGDIYLDVFYDVSGMIHKFFYDTTNQGIEGTGLFMQYKKDYKHLGINVFEREEFAAMGLLPLVTLMNLTKQKTTPYNKYLKDASLNIPLSGTSIMMTHVLNQLNKSKITQKLDIGNAKIAKNTWNMLTENLPLTDKALVTDSFSMASNLIRLGSVSSIKLADMISNVQNIYRSDLFDDGFDLSLLRKFTTFYKCALGIDATRSMLTEQLFQTAYDNMYDGRSNAAVQELFSDVNRLDEMLITSVQEQIGRVEDEMQQAYGTEFSSTREYYSVTKDFIGLHHFYDVQKNKVKKFFTLKMMDWIPRDEDELEELIGRLGSHKPVLCPIIMSAFDSRMEFEDNKSTLPLYAFFFFQDIFDRYKNDSTYTEEDLFDIDEIIAR